MGRKVHPVGFRLKVNRDWDARWYAEGNEFAELLKEDFAIRRFIKKKAKDAFVSRIEIDRNPNLVQVTIHTGRPGILIGKKGEAVKEIRTTLETMTNKKVKVEVNEIQRPDTDALLIAENIVQNLEKRVGHGRVIKRAITQAMRQGAQGVKVEVSGRLAGSDMARREWQSDGRVPRNTLRADIDYAKTEALTTFGRIGVKVWVYRGDIYGDEAKPTPKMPVEAT